MAYNIVDPPDFTKWRVKKLYDYESVAASYEGLEELEQAINAARKAMFLLTEKINEYERKEREAKMYYDRSYRQEFMASNEKTDSAKRIRAEIKCEQLENEWAQLDQLKKELIRTAQTLNTEIAMLQTMGHNLRQQMKMI